VRYAKATSFLQGSAPTSAFKLPKRLDLGFYEETLIFQLLNFGDLIRGKDVPSLDDLLGGFCKCSTSLTIGETDDLPSSG
jgi:hypothetical protein